MSLTPFVWLLCVIAYTLGALSAIAVHRYRHHRGGTVSKPRNSGFVRRHIAAIAVASIVIFDVLPTFGVGYLYVQQRDAAQQRADDLATSTAAIAAATAEFRACINQYAAQTYVAQTTRQHASTALRNAQQAVLDAQQTVSDDILALLSATPKTAPPLVKKLRTDLAAQHDAIATESDLKRQLDAEIATHPYPLPPKEACP